MIFPNKYNHVIFLKLLEGKPHTHTQYEKSQYHIKIDTIISQPLILLFHSVHFQSPLLLSIYIHLRRTHIIPLTAISTTDPTHLMLDSFHDVKLFNGTMTSPFHYAITILISLSSFTFSVLRVFVECVVYVHHVVTVTHSFILFSSVLISHFDQPSLFRDEDFHDGKIPCLIVCMFDCTKVCTMCVYERRKEAIASNEDRDEGKNTLSFFFFCFCISIQYFRALKWILLFKNSCSSCDKFSRVSDAVLLTFHLSEAQWRTFIQYIRGYLLHFFYSFQYI